MRSIKFPMKVIDKASRPIYYIMVILRSLGPSQSKIIMLVMSCITIMDERLARSHNEQYCMQTSKAEQQNV